MPPVPDEVAAAPWGGVFGAGSSALATHGAASARASGAAAPSHLLNVRKSNLPTLERQSNGGGTPQIPCARFPSASGNLPNLRLRLAAAALGGILGAKMSLRLRILLAFVLVLVSGSGVGLALAGLEARQWLRDELWTAQLSAHLQVARAFSVLPHADPDVARPPRSMAGLVATFSGNRHLEAVVVDPGGRVIAASEPAPAGPAAPAWFADLMRPDIPPTRLAIPGADGAAVELRPLYADDTAETWAELLDIALVLALATVGGGVAVFALVTWAMRPVTGVGRVLPRIGAGDYAARAPEQGPPEIVALGRGVNEMAARLAAMRERNRALEEQILTLQDEERADIARDLHDEIGPHLFAANVDAAMAASLIGSGKAEDALDQVRRVTAAIGHIQRLVRDILGRLRPTHLAELGLSMRYPRSRRLLERAAARHRLRDRAAGRGGQPAGAGAGNPLPPGAGEPQQRRPPRRAA